jgi:hypothetical protein
VCYYSGFYSSLCYEKRGNVEFVKKKVEFRFILRILQKHKYTCVFENNNQTIAISSFLIAQRAAKSRIIANLLKIIKNIELFLILKGSDSNLCWKSADMEYFVDETQKAHTLLGTVIRLFVPASVSLNLPKPTSGLFEHTLCSYAAL